MDIEFVARVLGAVEPRGVDRFDRSASTRPPAKTDRDATSESRRRATVRGVEVSLSSEARALVGLSEAGATENDRAAADESDAAQARNSDGSREGASRPGDLTKDEEEEVTRLEQRDADVRAHENAHKAAAGRYARGGPSYEYERGPDGRRYAVGGEVQIDTAPIPNDPDATIQKMQQVRRAALAPAEPSPQDRRVASEATQQEMSARQEKFSVEREERASKRATAYGQPAERPVGGSLDVVA